MKQYTDAKVADKVADKTENRILAILRKDTSITTPQIAERLHMSDSGVRKVLSALKQQHLVRRIGPNKGGHWEVADNS